MTRDLVAALATATLIIGACFLAARVAAIS